MAARARFTCGLLLLWAGAGFGCGARPPRRPPSPPVTAGVPAGSERATPTARQDGASETAATSLGPPPRCPRLPRAQRIYSGFAQDVPVDQLHVALDAVVPIQEILGQLFCAPDKDLCRPHRLLSIELSDALPSAARVLLEGRGADATPRHELLLLHDDTGWHAEPASLRAALADCPKSATPSR